MRVQFIPVFAVLLSAAFACAARADDSKAEKGVKETASRAQEAFNRHDAAALAATFMKDATIAAGEKERLVGRDEIQKNYAEAFAGPLKQAHVNIEMRHCQMVRPDVALCDMVDHLKPSDGADAQEVEYVVVLVAEGEKWLVSAIRMGPAVGK